MEPQKYIENPPIILIPGIVNIAFDNGMSYQSLFFTLFLKVAIEFMIVSNSTQTRYNRAMLTPAH